MIQYKVHVQSIDTHVPDTVHVLFILSEISKDILRACLRTSVADIPKIFKNVQPSSVEKFDVLMKKRSVVELGTK